MKTLLHTIQFGLFVLLVLCGSLSCSSALQKEQTDQQQLNDFRFKGNAIALQAQNTLLAHVQQAMKSGGVQYAVAFCSERAMEISDSISKSVSCTVQRISARNRNPHNAPSTEQEEKLLANFAEMKSRGIIPRDTVVINNDRVEYFKPIMVTMPACLQCHGAQEIAPGTIAALKEKYPNDKATGYALGDFRGMWKIIFHTTHQ